MFGFGKKKEEPKQQAPQPINIAQIGAQNQDRVRVRNIIYEDS